MQHQSFHLTGTDITNFAIRVDTFAIVLAGVISIKPAAFFTGMAWHQRAFTFTAFQKPHQNGFGFLACDCASIDGVFFHDGADFIPRLHINDGWMAPS